MFVKNPPLRLLNKKRGGGGGDRCVCAEFPLPGAARDGCACVRACVRVCVCVCIY